ncbi:hypothetical protein D3C76_1078610 [compost metagenome]
MDAFGESGSQIGVYDFVVFDDIVYTPNGSYVLSNADFYCFAVLAERVCLLENPDYRVVFLYCIYLILF